MKPELSMNVKVEGLPAVIARFTELHQAVATRDAVIKRLLDGWEPVADRNPAVWSDPTAIQQYEPMSDGEAAIIRQHQEKT